MTKKGSVWDKVFEQLQNPWDWAAATLGAAGGATVSIILHGTELGHSVPAGALGTVGARKALVASFRRRTLRNRAHSLERILKGHGASDLNAWLSDAWSKWDERIMSNEDFEKRIKMISDEDSKRLGVPLKLTSGSEKNNAGRRLARPRSRSPVTSLSDDDED